MSNTADPVPRKNRRWRWIAAGLLIAVLAVGFSMRPRRQEPLATVRLEDGTILELRDVHNSPEDVLVVLPGLPAKSRLRQLTGRLFGQYEIRGEATPQITRILVSLRDPNTGQPLDAVTVGHAVFIDQYGWPHASVTCQCHAFSGPRSDISYRSQGAKSALPRASYREIVLSFRFPKLPAQRGTFQLYSQDKKLLGEVPVEISPDPRIPTSTVAAKLPTTLEAHGLGVTLEDLELEELPESLPGVREFKVVPRFSLSWRGGNATGWNVEIAERFPITDAWGNVSQSNRCTLSPYAAPWKLEVKVTPGSNASHDADQLWTSPEIPIPAAGESQALEHELELAGVKLKLLRILGAGHHEYTTPLPYPGLGGWSSHTANGKLLKQVRVDGQTVHWLINTDSPQLHLLHTDDEDYTLKLEVQAPDGRLFVSGQAFYDPTGPVEVDDLDFRPRPETTSVKLNVKVLRNPRFEFTVQPPAPPETKPAP